MKNRMDRVFASRTASFSIILIFSLSLLLVTGCQKSVSGATDHPSSSSEIASATEQTENPPSTDLPGLGTTTVQGNETPVQTAETQNINTPSAIAVAPTDYPKDFWKDLPVIPTEISDRVREVYQKGLELGNNPRHFTKIGDCNSQHPDFLSGFDHVYYLGEYAYLQPAIDYFKGSFGILSQTTNPGMNTARVLSYLWKTEDCPSSDTLLECQYRVDKPIFAIIMLGTNDGYFHQTYPANFERNMRAIIERTMDLGIVPILATKVDNNEGDGSMNPIIARLAMEYEIPLWNFWRAAQPLTNGGLRDHEHLNSGSGPPATDFRMEISLSYGKEMKNLTALQVLDFLMRELADPSTIPVQASTVEINSIK